MTPVTGPPCPMRRRDLLYFRTPGLWPTWPFLPVVRPRPGGAGSQVGVLYDARGVSRTYGFSAAVFLTNLFLLPHTEAALLAGPKCVYDTVEEMAGDGWTVD